MRRALGLLAVAVLVWFGLPLNEGGSLQIRAAQAVQTQTQTPNPTKEAPDKPTPLPAPTVTEAPTPEPTPSPTPRPSSIDFTFSSRRVEVYATATVPFGEGPFPLVLMINGHGAGRNENTGFPSIAMWLAEQGMATVRMDFPGCGDSTEPFTKNTQTNMKRDIINAYQFMLDNYPIDESRVGAFGFSMGGRLTLELIVDGAIPLQAIALLAPAADTDDLKVLFGGQDNWRAMKAEANRTAKGYANYLTEWGREYQLSKEWFRDLEKYRGRTLIDKASRKFSGPSLVIYSVDDEAVSPHVSRAVADALHSQIVIAPIDGHAYGFFTNKYLVLHLVETSVVTFFSYNLRDEAPLEATHPLMNGGFAIVKSRDRGPVNFRARDSLKAQLLHRIPHGTTVRVVAQGADWTRVRYEGKEGYVQTNFLEAIVR